MDVAAAAVAARVAAHGGVFGDHRFFSVHASIARLVLPSVTAEAAWCRLPLL